MLSEDSDQSIQYLEQALMTLTQNSQASPSVTQTIVTASCMHLWDMLQSANCTQEATATILLLPDWLAWSKNGYMSWIHSYPEHTCVLARFCANSMLLNYTEVWLSAPPQPQHSNKRKCS